MSGYRLNRSPGTGTGSGSTSTAVVSPQTTVPQHSTRSVEVAPHSERGSTPEPGSSASPHTVVHTAEVPAVALPLDISGPGSSAKVAPSEDSTPGSHTADASTRRSSSDVAGAAKEFTLQAAATVSSDTGPATVSSETRTSSKTAPDPDEWKSDEDEPVQGVLQDVPVARPRSPVFACGCAFRRAMSRHQRRKLQGGIAAAAAVMALCAAFAAAEVVSQEDGWVYRIAAYGLILAAAATLLASALSTARVGRRAVMGAAAVSAPALVLLDATGVTAWPLLVVLSHALIIVHVPTPGQVLMPVGLAVVWLIARAGLDAADALGAGLRRSDHAVCSVASALTGALSAVLLLPLPLRAMDSGRSLRRGVRLAHSIATAMLDFDLEGAEQLIGTVEANEGPLAELAQAMVELVAALRMHLPYLPDALLQGHGENTGPSDIQWSDEYGTDIDEDAPAPPGLIRLAQENSGDDLGTLQSVSEDVNNMVNLLNADRLSDSAAQPNSREGSILGYQRPLTHGAPSMDSISLAVARAPTIPIGARDDSPSTTSTTPAGLTVDSGCPNELRTAQQKRGRAQTVTPGPKNQRPPPPAAVRRRSFSVAENTPSRSSSPIDQAGSSPSVFASVGADGGSTTGSAAASTELVKPQSALLHHAPQARRRGASLRKAAMVGEDSLAPGAPSERQGSTDETASRSSGMPSLGGSTRSRPVGHMESHMIRVPGDAMGRMPSRPFGMGRKKDSTSTTMTPFTLASQYDGVQVFHTVSQLQGAPCVAAAQHPHPPGSTTTPATSLPSGPGASVRVGSSLLGSSTPTGGTDYSAVPPGPSALPSWAPSALPSGTSSSTMQSPMQFSTFTMDHRGFTLNDSVSRRMQQTSGLHDANPLAASANPLAQRTPALPPAVAGDPRPGAASTAELSLAGVSLGMTTGVRSPEGVLRTPAVLPGGSAFSGNMAGPSPGQRVSTTSADTPQHPGRSMAPPAAVLRSGSSVMSHPKQLRLQAGNDSQLSPRGERLASWRRPSDNLRRAMLSGGVAASLRSTCIDDLERQEHDQRLLRRQRQLDAGASCRAAAVLVAEPPDGASVGVAKPMGPLGERRMFEGTQGLLAAALHAVWQDGGDVIVLRADSLFAGWNTHKTCVRHARAACRAALAASSAAGGAWAAAAAAGRLLCGQCGVPGRRMAAFASGAPAQQARYLVHLAVTLGLPALVTEGIREQTEAQFEHMPVDAIPSVPAVPSSQQCLVYWLCGPAGGQGRIEERSAEEQRLHMVAFSHFLSHRFEEAQILWTQLLQCPRGGLADSQMRRLLHLSEVAIRSPAVPFPFPYVRTLPVWRDFEALLGTQQAGAAAPPPHPEPQRGPPGLVALETPAPNLHAAERDDVSMNSDAAALKQCIELAVKKPSARRGSTSSCSSASSGGKSSGSDDDPEDALPSSFDAGGTRYWRSAKQLGKGAAGEVWLGMGDFGGLVALKYLRLPKNQPQGRTSTLRPRAAAGGGGNAVDQLITEVRLLSHLRHDNVVGYLGSGVVPLGSGVVRWAVIAMECVSGGSLQQMIDLFGTEGGIPGSSTLRYTKDMLRGLAFLHKHDIVHRDFKPGNVLLTIDGLAKLADFGASAMLSTVGRGGAVVGTPLFIAPEAARGECVKPSDIWGVGLTVLQLVTGLPALRCFDVPGDRGVDMNWFVRWLAKNDSARPVIPEHVSGPAREFVSACTMRDPAVRPTADELLCHHFLC